MSITDPYYKWTISAVNKYNGVRLTDVDISEDGKKVVVSGCTSNYVIIWVLDALNGI